MLVLFDLLHDLQSKLFNCPDLGIVDIANGNGDGNVNLYSAIVPLVCSEALLQ